MQGYLGPYNTVHDYSGPCMTIEDYAGPGPYKNIQVYAGPYKIPQHDTELNRTIQISKGS